MSFKYLAVALATAAFTTPAFAEAGPLEGPRAELHAGFDRIRVKAHYDDGVTAVSGSDHKDGFLFGGELGYDKLVGPNVTLGAYAGVDFSSVKQCSSVFGNDKACVEAARNFTLGVRAATALSPTLSLYAKGGYSNGRVKARYRDFADSTNNFSASENRGGFHLGAGLEARLAHNFYGKVEYDYTDYSNFHDDVAGVSYGVDARRHQLLTGVGVRF